MRTGLCSAVGSAILTLCILSGLAYAQDKKTAGKEDRPVNAKKGVPLPPGGPTPRLADGHPDFSGVWFQGSTGGHTFDAAARKQFDSKVTPEEPPSFQPWAAAKIKAMSSTEYELGRASVNCLPRGVPGMVLINPYPFQLVETPGQLVQLDELNNNWRVIQPTAALTTPIQIRVFLAMRWAAGTEIPWWWTRLQSTSGPGIISQAGSTAIRNT